MALTTLGLAASSDAATGKKLCRVKNATQDSWFATNSGLALTRAIDAARSGDRLNVFGTCRGSFTPTVDLTIVGSRSAMQPTVLLGTDPSRAEALAVSRSRRAPPRSCRTRESSATRPPAGPAEES
jgi:hypothetical protein